MIKYIKRLFTKFTAWMSYNPPGALSSRGWRLFNEEFKKVAPIRYWIDNDFKRQFVYPVNRKYDAVVSWLTHRLICRYHILRTGLKPGYHDKDTIMLYSNFNILRDFVEIELAAGESSEETWQEKYIPFYRLLHPSRDPANGIKHLKWASTLDDPTLPVYEQSAKQAVSAREMLVLYTWWVHERPARVAFEPQYPIDFSGDDFDIFDQTIRNTDEYKKYQADLMIAENQETEWSDEDDRMLIRLMQIRKSMWS